MGQFIFIRHARSIQNKSIAPSRWIVSPVGESEILKLSQEPEIQKLDLLYSSTELKAQITAQKLIKTLQKSFFPELLIDNRLNEVNRDDGIFFPTEEDFKQAVKKSFDQKQTSYDSWESATHALKRITAFINELQQREDLKDKIIGIVSHGTILNLYFALKGGYYDNTELLYTKWEQTTFCGWGKIVNDKIIRELS